MTDVERARRCVEHFRRIGLCPLPSRSDLKGPAMESYAHHYGPTPVPESIYESWDTSSMQLITGTQTPTPTKIIAVDCDGPEAADVWARWLKNQGHSLSTTWVVRTGGGGFHAYFRLPEGVKSCPTGMLWGLWDTAGGKDGRGGWMKHREVKILADRALVRCPPSLHPDTGQRYSFDRDRNPNRITLPDLAPRWLLALPRLTAPRIGQERHPARMPRKRFIRPAGALADRDAILDAVADKIALAASWGLRVCSQEPNTSGWVRCHAIGREDRVASGSFSSVTGTYQDRLDLSTCSFFDLGARLQPGLFADWRDCLAWCASRYLNNPYREAVTTARQFSIPDRVACACADACTCTSALRACARTRTPAN
jgi:hypothetical protein